jgi:hypothetical protein
MVSANAVDISPDHNPVNQPPIFSNAPLVPSNRLAYAAQRVWQSARKFGGFIGPGRFSTAQEDLKLIPVLQRDAKYYTSEPPE